MVTTVLVLDHSGSMADKADGRRREAEDRGAARGGVALRGADAADGQDDAVAVQQRHRQAAAVQRQQGRVNERRFRSCSRPRRHAALRRDVLPAWKRWRRRGCAGKKAVVVLTDGMDESPGSRRTDRGRDRGGESGGRPVVHARPGPHGRDQRAGHEKDGRGRRAASISTPENQQKLFDIFEKLSIDLHDDGIDEKALRTLAEQTGGKYYSGRDVSKLSLIYEELTEELESTYTVTFAEPPPGRRHGARRSRFVERGGRDRERRRPTPATLSMASSFRRWTIAFIWCCWPAWPRCWPLRPACGGCTACSADENGH